MRVLVVEEVPGDAAVASQALVAAGHEITSCHRNGSAFPCRGIGASPECPIEAEGVDVALLVRSLPGSQPTAREDGVRCALRRHIPLVIAGEVDQSPYSSMATAVETDLDRAPAAVEAAAAAPLPFHGDVASDALRTVLTAEGLSAEGADATVRRHGTQLLVTLRPGVDVDQKVVEIAAIRVLASVRALDPHASMIDVSLGT